MFVKLCGFTRPEDIIKVMELPLSSIGFIFYKKSVRYVDPGIAGLMSGMLDGSGIIRTGVFVDESVESILKTADNVGLDMVQVYDPDLAAALSGRIPVISCFRVNATFPGISLPEPLPEEWLLFDTYDPDVKGGSGKSFNWDILAGYPHRDRMIIAGGINSGNIVKLIREVNPGGIDLSSGIEDAPGIKSIKKILEIMSLIEEAEYGAST